MAENTSEPLSQMRLLGLTLKKKRINTIVESEANVDTKRSMSIMRRELSKRPLRRLSSSRIFIR